MITCLRAALVSALRAYQHPIQRDRPTWDQRAPLVALMAVSAVLVILGSGIHEAAGVQGWHLDLGTEDRGENLCV